MEKDLLYFLLIFLMGFCVINDFKIKKIPNFITFPVIIVGILYNSVFYRLNGLKFSLSGICIAFFLFMSVSFFIKGIGYGDVKMLMAIGSCLGYKNVINIFIVSVFLSFIVSFLLKPKETFKSLKNIFLAGYSIAFLHQKLEFPNIKTSNYKFIFGIYIYVALLLVVFMKITFIN